MNTIYLKIHGADGMAAAVEAVSDPVYVYGNPVNGEIQRCHPVKAWGVLDASGGKIYQLSGRQLLDWAEATVSIITRAEYDELLATMHVDDDPELSAEQALQYITEGSYEA